MIGGGENTWQKVLRRAASRQGFIPSRGAWKPHSVRAKSVGEFVPALMRPAFEKYGFPAAAILTDWAAIAGTELAAFTAPERLKWPRKSSSDTDGGGQAATLILRVDGPRALEVEHLRPRLIERINASFGYRAVADIRVLQAPLVRRDAPRTRPMPPQPVEHGRLRRSERRPREGGPGPHRSRNRSRSPEKRAGIAALERSAAKKRPSKELEHAPIYRSEKALISRRCHHRRNRHTRQRPHLALCVFIGQCRLCSAPMPRRPTIA